MTYVKKRRLTIEQWITKLFNEDKSLIFKFNLINPSTTSDIKKKCKELLKNKQVRSIARRIKSELNTLVIEKWNSYIANKSFEYGQFVRILGYVQIYDHWEKWNKSMDPINKTWIDFHKNGKLQTNFNVKFKYYAKYKNIYFKNSESMFFFILNDLKNQVITFTNDFFEFLKREFLIKKTNIRALISKLERYKKFQKIESKMFILARSNKQEIANEMFVKINISNANIIYFTKNVFMNLVTDVIQKYQLLYDEPYYIFKEYFNDKFYFSHGNEMFFTKIKEYADYKMQERINNFVTTPQVLTIYELETQLGINKFGVVNNKFIKNCGEKFLIYVHKNLKHRQYLRKTFLPFIKNLNKDFFAMKDLRQFCHLSEDIHIKRLSEYKNLPWIVTDIFNFILYDKNKLYEFKIQNINFSSSVYKIKID